MDTDDRLSAIIKTGRGFTYSGTLWRGPAPAAPFEVGLTATPAETLDWFNTVGPAVPAFTRVYSPPGAGLPDPVGHIASLPPTCRPWISHKDQVPIDTVRRYWDRMPPGCRWTYFHERAPGDADARRDYVVYWQELMTAAVDYPGIDLVQIQSNYAMRWRTDTDWRQWLIPGISLGFDCYPLAGHRYEPPESMFGLLQHAATFAEAPTWGVPELGAEPRAGQNRARWIVDCVDYLRTAGASFVGLWCAQDHRTGLDYRPTDPDTLAAYKELLA